MKLGGKFGEDKNLSVLVALTVNAQAFLGEVNVRPL